MKYTTFYCCYQALYNNILMYKNEGGIKKSRKNPSHSETAFRLGMRFKSFFYYIYDLFGGAFFQTGAFSYGLSLTGSLLHHRAYFQRQTEQRDKALRVLVVVQFSGSK